MIELSDSDENGFSRELLGCSSDACLAILGRVDLYLAFAIANENRNVTKHMSLKCAWLLPQSSQHPFYATDKVIKGPDMNTP